MDATRETDRNDAGEFSASSRFEVSKGGIALLGIVMLAPWLGGAASATAGACSSTSLIGERACRSDVHDDLLEQLGICANRPDPAERLHCVDHAYEEWIEARLECREVREARDQICDAIGEAPYDPDFDPDDFEEDFDAPAKPNPYWPTDIGNQWEYVGGSETIRVEVLDERKLIEGVSCITFRDVVEDDGDVIEDTLDWYALSLTGDAWYCGEIAVEFETFEGDDPELPEIVGIDGSWKAGREGSEPGVIMWFAPQVGQVYRQEWAFREAEDMGEVLGNHYGYGEDPDLDQFVPQALADALCDDDCVVTRDFTPLEPGVEERKYFAPGIGPFLEVNVEQGEIVQLVDCNFDARCAALPAP